MTVHCKFYPETDKCTCFMIAPISQLPKHYAVQLLKTVHVFEIHFFACFQVLQKQHLHTNKMTQAHSYHYKIFG